MLSENKLLLLQQLVQDATAEEITWTKGYLAGYAAKGNIVDDNPMVTAVSAKPLIIYGTETGNSKKVATGLLANFKKHKVNAKVIDIFQFNILKLEKETLALFVMSTQGEGEFPQNAVAFYETLRASGASLPQLNYAVFGLGDVSYPLFNNAAELLDAELEKKGAKRLLPLVKADVDYKADVALWENDLILAFNGQEGPKVAISPSPHSEPQKKNYAGKVIHKIVLNDRGSNKETYHIEIASGDEIHYEPGDALGIFPKNNISLIRKIAGFFKNDPGEELSVEGKKATVEQWLSGHNITGLGKHSLKAVGSLLQVEITEEKADLEDILEKYPIPETVGIVSLIAILLPIAPRLYSIASSSGAHDGQVHLTVSLSKFISSNKAKTGLASQYFADFAINEDIDFYIHKNPNFRLPADDTDIIMIGPGTGIAPFRSFISQRDAVGAAGKNWLFFGEQHFVQDFYYQTEIQDWLSSGVLSKLDVAFSRDQQHKIYVQDRIRENAGLFNQWIEEGAVIYICGQKFPMSQDVENTIVEVIASQRNIALDEAKEVLESLEAAGRYQKDVY